MPAPEDKGKTLWEMLQQRLGHRGHGNGNGDGAALNFANPLDLRIDSPVPMAFANGPEFANYSFTVQAIRQYIRRIGSREFSFTDYELFGTNIKTFDAEDAMVPRVRVIENQAGGHDALLLRLFDEFAFAEDFLALLNDGSGVIELKNDDAAPSGPAIRFKRVNDLRDSYEADILLVTRTTAEGKAVPSKASALKVEYWDYWRDVETAPGKTAKEFLFVEKNSETGWFQIWRGREFFS